MCEWLELVGLGTYRDTFRGKSCHMTLSTNGITLININLFCFSEKDVDGATLLSMDVQLFGIERYMYIVQSLCMTDVYMYVIPRSGVGSGQC